MLNPDQIPMRVYSHSEYLESHLEMAEYKSKTEDLVDEINLENIRLVQENGAQKNLINAQRKGIHFLEIKMRDLIIENNRLRGLIN